MLFSADCIVEICWLSPAAGAAAASPAAGVTGATAVCPGAAARV